MKEWFTAAELAELALPGMPTNRTAFNRLTQRGGWSHPDREWSETENPLGIWRKRVGRGGGVEYHLSLLPSQAQAKLLVDAKIAEPAAASSAVTKAALGVQQMWEWFEKQPDKAKGKAATRLSVLDMVEAMVRNGQKKEIAVALIAVNQGIAGSSIWGWYGRVQGQDRPHWLPFLADRYVGRTREAEISPDAWEAFKGFYLRLEAPTLTRCYRDLEKLARENGWSVPSEKTLARKIEREIAAPVLVLTREGPDALKRMYPPMERDRSCFHALEAINGDGHKWDVFVLWPDGSVGRPMMVTFQDLYSNKILSWRVDKSENRESIRLALGDVVEQFGIPDHIWFDNTRAFANKALTGGASHRYRFKTRDEDPIGICEQMGINVHFTLPYSGQSKPVERAFRDVAHDMAKAPDFAGAYTGHSPDNKPANYGERAIPLDDFLKVAAREIAEWNARPGRRTKIAGGRSFDQVFEDSLTQAATLIRRATPEMARLWLLAAEGISAHSDDGSLRLLENRFWGEWLQEHRGEKLIVRFDPQNVLDGLHVYDLAGKYLGHAPVLEASGFADVNAAREHARQRNAFLKATKAMVAAERSMSALELAALLPEAEAPEAAHINPTVIHASFDNTALAAAPTTARHQEQERFLDSFGKAVLRLVPTDSDL